MTATNCKASERFAFGRLSSIAFEIICNIEVTNEDATNIDDEQHSTENDDDSNVIGREREIYSRDKEKRKN